MMPTDISKTRQAGAKSMDVTKNTYNESNKINKIL